MWIIDHLFNLRGVDANTPVVVYDEQSGMRAARAFWFLEYFGHPRVQVLDGGFGAWIRAGLPVTREAAPPPKSTLDRHAAGAHDRDLARREGPPRAPRTSSFSTRAATPSTTARWCARSAAARSPARCTSSGRATSAPTARSSRPPSCARCTKPAGVTPDKEVVTYCQGGYRAAHAYLALRLLGYPRVRNYTGSWKEWGDREDLPIEKVTVVLKVLRVLRVLMVLVLMVLMVLIGADGARLRRGRVGRAT